MPLIKRCFLLLLFLWCCLGTSLANEDAQALYWVSLSDKAGTPYSVLKPIEFLSPRAIQRRTNQGIPILENDLPVNPDYIRGVEATGAKVRYTSKWLNTITILATKAMVSQIEKLTFVTQVEYVGRYYKPKEVRKKERPTLKPYQVLPNEYGYSDHQIRMLNGQALHQLGFSGNDQLIAVLDGGFNGVDLSPFYDSLRAHQRMFPGKDFVDIDEEVYESSSHGAQVLSTMAAHLPGLYIGSAPGASYTCIKTEDTRGEYLIEECNWVAGAEYADSIGANLINSSLGYTTFNDTSMNYRYEDLDGLKSRASRAADVAFSKGMIVVNSAGNSGNDAWRYIGTPADANFVLAVGATDFLGQKASFSSYGPTPDGRIKPNISAMGENIAVAPVSGYTVQASNGTSFSSPLMTGMIASLWSALPEYTNAEIFQIVQMAGSNYPEPDNELGYGIPDFLGAFLRERVSENILYLSGTGFLAVIPEHTRELHLILVPNDLQTAKVKINNALGELMWKEQREISDPGELKIWKVPGSALWASGIYSVELERGGVVERILLRVE